MTGRKWIFVLVPVLALGFLISARFKDIAKSEAQQKSEAGARRGGAASVEIATAQEQPIIQSIETVGTVTAEFTVNLSPRVSGRITYLEVREGETVKPGQLLARIDPSQAEAGVLSARASINESRSRLAQAEATSQANAIEIEQAIQQARAEAVYAKSALTQTQKSAEARIAASQATVKQSQGAITAAQAGLKNRKAQVIAGEANLKNAQLKEERTKSLYEKGYVSKQDLDNAVAATASAVAALDVQRAEVEGADADLNSAKASYDSDVASLRAIRATTEAEIESAKARLTQANSALKTAEGNRAQLPANRANLEALKAGVDIADAQLKGAASQKSDTELKSTILGTITKRSADPGSIASPGQAVLTIESTNSIFVDANIPIDQSARVKRGDRVELTIDGLPDSKILARIDQIVPSADVQDRQVLVRIRVQNQEDAIKPGMFAKVLIETKRVESKVVIPLDAVKQDKVFVINAENKAEEREVVLGERDENNVQVLSGLEVGDRVIVLSFSPVKDGGLVSVTAERRLDGTRVVIEPEKKNDKKESADKPKGGK